MPADAPLTTSVRPSAIADALRDDILSTAIAPGAPVTEAAVAVRFGCARPTARAAIDRLVAEGVLLREAHRAAEADSHGGLGDRRSRRDGGGEDVVAQRIRDGRRAHRRGEWRIRGHV